MMEMKRKLSCGTDPLEPAKSQPGQAVSPAFFVKMPNLLGGLIPWTRLEHWPAMPRLKPRLKSRQKAV